MATSFNTYLTPGVTVQEIPTPSVPSPVGIPGALPCLIGESVNYTTGQDTFLPTTTAPYTLSQLGVAVSTNSGGVEVFTNGSVVDRYTGVVFTPGTDYTITVNASTDGNSIDTTTILAPTSGSRMLPANGGSGFALINYQYTNSSYFQPYLFRSFNSVSAFYGSPLTASGQVNSPLSLAAYFAFQNGAQEIMCLAVESSSSTPSNTDWSNSINQLTSQQGIDVIVPITGTQTVHDDLYSFINIQALNSIYTRGFVGLDGVANSVTTSVIQAEAQGFNSTRMTVVSPPVVTFNAGLNGLQSQSIIYLGGQYLAAGLAGLFASQSGVQIPMTQKAIAGFYSIPNQLTKTDTVTLQSNGVCCLYQHRSGAILVQQALTTNMTDYLSREISVQAAEDKLYQVLDNTLLSQGLIGNVLLPSTPLTVASAVVNALDTAMQSGLIQGYDTITYSVPPNNPTTVLITFLYLPTLPLNYIQVQYGIDTTSGATGFSSTVSGLTASSTTA